MKARVQSAYQRALYVLPDDLEFARLVRDHAESHEKLLEQLRAAAAVEGDRRRIRKLQHRILTSFSSKLACVVPPLAIIVVFGSTAVGHVIITPRHRTAHAVVRRRALAVLDILAERLGGIGLVISDAAAAELRAKRYGSPEPCRLIRCFLRSGLVVRLAPR